ncbi:hypothetical protein [Paenibacillus tuaregi]|uniref:hypothetical protein n=1 Tax=Paenibacillus tuaregi TaxID=1816681 RepID=UPI000839983F|nr:hypothetical protein [Paenibacillus tuaregi]
MSAEIISFPNKVADVLEEAAVMARRGEITGVVIGAMLAGGDTLTAHSGVNFRERGVLITDLNDKRTLDFIDVNFE